MTQFTAPPKLGEVLVARDDDGTIIVGRPVKVFTSVEQCLADPSVEQIIPVEAEES